MRERPLCQNAAALTMPRTLVHLSSKSVVRVTLAPRRVGADADADADARATAIGRDFGG
jgi:hypothetical protein